MSNKSVILTRYHPRSDTTLQCGVDEAGRGCLIGSVYTAAVILDPNKELPSGMVDSKKLSRKRRGELREWIEANALSWNVAWSTNAEIDNLNILRATHDAMRRAICSLSVQPELALIDGDSYTAGGLPCPHVCVVKGDNTYAPIAAASILAKEYHDSHIMDLIEDNPFYGVIFDLENNMGYGTPKHLAGLLDIGPTEHHRRTFGRVRDTPKPEKKAVTSESRFVEKSALC